MTSARGQYDGVLSILRYNKRSYLASACVLLAVVLLLWLHVLPRVFELILIAAAVFALFWSLSSILASCYVYDYIGVTRWRWIPGMLAFPPENWLNIHAGLDESTEILQDLYPGTRYLVLDIYDPLEMTEPSIAIAREAHALSQPTAIAAKLEALPVSDATHDSVFLLFAAHEIRQAKRRSEFFSEAARVLSNGGQLLLVEHLRDWKNFVAFGPGFWHFQSRREWRRVAHEAGLTIEREKSITPLVRSFLLSKAGG